MICKNTARLIGKCPHETIRQDVRVNGRAVRESVKAVYNIVRGLLKRAFCCRDRWPCRQYRAAGATFPSPRAGQELLS